MPVRHFLPKKCKTIVLIANWTHLVPDVALVSIVDMWVKLEIIGTVTKSSQLAPFFILHYIRDVIVFD